MPRFYPFRKAYAKLKKVFKRRPKKAKSNTQNGLLHTKKVVLNGRILAQGNVTQFYSDTFELSDIPQWGQYQALYEEYKINKIVFSIKSLDNVALVGSNVALNTLGMVHSIIDYNDAVVPTSIQTMMNDSTYKGTRSSRTHTRVFTPRWLNNVAGGVSAQNKTGWLDTATPSVSHYSIKYALEGGSMAVPATSFIVELIVTYYISFKNPK